MDPSNGKAATMLGTSHHGWWPRATFSPCISPKPDWPHKKNPTRVLSVKNGGNRVTRWPPPDAPHSVGALIARSKLSRCRPWLPPAVTPPGKAKQPPVTLPGATTTLQPCSMMDSHTADSVPRKQEHTWRGDTAALKPTPVSSLQLPLQMPSAEA